jgi:hypothetical protein
MAVAEDEQTEQNGSSPARTALVAAAAAAATGAAAFAARKALSHDDQDDSGDDDDDGGESMVSKLKPSSKSKGKRDTSSVLTSAASSAWDSAQGVILPIAEDAMAAAGKYLAEEAPDIVRERLVPRFIEAFNDAS